VPADFAVMVAPGITAPVGSVTTPVIDPVSACDQAGWQLITSVPRNARANRIALLRFMAFLLEL
jgi:hypothetical protein